MEGARVSPTTGRAGKRLTVERAASQSEKVQIVKVQPNFNRKFRGRAPSIFEPIIREDTLHRAVAHGKGEKAPAFVAARIWAINNWDEKAYTCYLSARVWMFWREKQDSKLFKLFKQNAVGEFEQHVLRQQRGEFTEDATNLIPTINILGKKDSEEDRELFLLNDDSAAGKALHPKDSINVGMTSMIDRVCRMDLDLHEFPFDEQELKFIMWLPKVEDRGRFQLVVDDELVVMHENIAPRDSVFRKQGVLEIKEQVVKGLPEFGFVSARLEEEGSNSSSATIVIELRRHPGYWLSRFCVPEFIISTMATISWAEEPTNFADRCSITLTMMLMLVATNITASQEMPNVPYLTFMDRYHYASIGYVATIVCENVVAKVISKRHGDDDTMGGNIDMYGFTAALGLWTLFHVYLCLKFYRWYGKNHVEN